MGSKRNWFEKNSDLYREYRPLYPDSLVDYLVSLLEKKCVALDVGCGTGQLTQFLAAYFDTVYGIDRSEQQIKYAVQTPNIEYLVCFAENIKIPSNRVDLITVGQAAHWFDLDLFYEEVRRLAKENSLIGLVSYGIVEMPPRLQKRFKLFYYDELKSFWPKERRLVEEGYSSIIFPFEELKSPNISMEESWDLSQFLGYVRTWSAVKNCLELGSISTVMDFLNDISTLWGDGKDRYIFRWKLNIRLGRI